MGNKCKKFTWGDRHTGEVKSDIMEEDWSWRSRGEEGTLDGFVADMDGHKQTDTADAVCHL